VSRGLVLSARTRRPGRPSAFACQIRLRTRSLPSGLPESRQSFTSLRSAPSRSFARIGFTTGTIANILQEHGLEPAPERNRKTTWKEFLSRHWEVIAAADFFTVEVWTRAGLTKFIVLFVMDLSTRRVQIAGIATKANGIWMDQVARNLCDAGDGFLTGKRYLIHDRDPLFTAEFLGTLAASGVKSVKLPPRSPNLNPHAERFVRTIKESCLERMILFGEGSLRKATHEFVEHYHRERNHQGRSNRLILPEASPVGNRGAIRRGQRMGGMLNYYYRQAA